MTGNREVMKRTLGQALQMASSSGASMFANYVEQAESRGIPLAKLFQERTETDLTSKIDVITYRMIGGNGMGKTERGVAEMVEAIKNEGLNPVIFKKGVYPKDPERDVLICHINCTGRDETFFSGIPYNEVVDVPVVDEDGVPQYDEHGNIKMRQTEQLSYSGSDEFRAAAMFPFSVFIFDEPNRATMGAQALLGGLYGGERVNGIRLSRGASLVVATQIGKRR
ncbi:MAG: hypothetical protein Q4B82_08580 [Alysiella sp.]|uniref:hypothetical protein n=1 Tax=Alysiella sp. TaxID=1872483 RepID=UPI0026DCD786|nr:hypothetical protein [Alysiella sp.]MDO4434617.1 hypothetical protein [Alysiella sp.]